MNLIEGLQSEMNRVREIIKEYESIPCGAGSMACWLMNDSIRNAEDCIAKGDTVGMVHAVTNLKEYEL